MAPYSALLLLHMCLSPYPFSAQGSRKSYELFFLRFFYLNGLSLYAAWAFLGSIVGKLLILGPYRRFCTARRSSFIESIRLSVRPYVCSSDQFGHEGSTGVSDEALFQISLLLLRWMQIHCTIHNHKCISSISSLGKSIV